MLVIDPGAERLPQGRAYCARPYNALFVSPLTNLRWYDILIFYGILSYFVQSRKKEGG